VGLSTPTTAAEWVSAIDDAIYALIMGAQSYSIGDRQLTRADLDKLRKLREYWTLEASTTGSVGLRNTYVRLRDAI